MKCLFAVLLLFPVAAFAQGGEIVSAPVTALGDARVVTLRVVDEDGSCITFGPSMLPPSDRDAFNGTKAQQRQFLLKSYLQMYEDLQGAAFRKAERSDVAKACPPIKSGAPGFVSFADMAAFLKDIKAQIANVDTAIKVLEKKIAEAPTSSASRSSSPRGSVSGGSVLGGLRGTVSGIQIPTPTPASREKLQNDRAVLMQERARLQELLPQQGAQAVQTSTPTTAPLPPAASSGGFLGFGGGRGNPSAVLAPRSSTAAPAQPSGNPVRIGGDVNQVNCISCPAPQYPELARTARISDTVMLSVIIAKDGSVKDVKVIRGHTLLQAAAVDAVKGWKYRPTMLNGEAVEVMSTISLSFVFK